MSARDVYHATTGGGGLMTSPSLPEAANPDAGRSRRPPERQVAVSPVARVNGTGSVAGMLPSSYSDYGQVPIRTQAQVMRIWVAPFEDANGDLVLPGFIYTEMDERRWSIASPVSASEKTFRPLLGRVNGANATE